MKTHKLKTWPSYFDAIRKGEKRFEVRINDRDFATGDVLWLMEYDPGKDTVVDDHKYTGIWIRCIVGFVLHGGQFGIERGHCVMSLQRVEEQPWMSPSLLLAMTT